MHPTLCRCVPQRSGDTEIARDSTRYGDTEEAMYPTGYVAGPGQARPGQARVRPDPGQAGFASIDIRPLISEASGPAALLPRPSFCPCDLLSLS